MAQHRFLGYDFASGDVSSLLPLQKSKRQRPGSEAMRFALARDVVWLLRPAYASMEFFVQISGRLMTMWLIFLWRWMFRLSMRETSMTLLYF